MCLPVPHRAYNTWVLHTPTHDPKAAPHSCSTAGSHGGAAECLLRSRQGHLRSEGLLVSPSSPHTRSIFITAATCPKVKVAGGKGGWGRGTGLARVPLLFPWGPANLHSTN